jgi:transposase-like protein
LTNINIINIERPECLYCGSNNTIKHGCGPNGKERYRCKQCKKTWTRDTVKPTEINEIEITEKYLGGESIRSLSQSYPASTIKINYIIKSFMSGLPPWEEYLDAAFESYHSRLILLTGKSFACHNPKAKQNQMFVAFAIDAGSSMILAYEISKTDTSNVWLSLLDKLNCRGIKPLAFMTNGTKIIMETIKLVFPDVAIKIPLHSKLRDKELSCCLSKFNFSEKLISDGLRIFENYSTQKLSKILKAEGRSEMLRIIFNNSTELFERLRTRLKSKNNFRSENVLDAFDKRFAQFRLLKGNPHHTVNAWVAYTMLSNHDMHFSPFSIFYQLPVKINFGNYACGNLPVARDVTFDQWEIADFTVEVVARSIELPVFFSNCDMQSEKCRFI